MVDFILLIKKEIMLFQMYIIICILVVKEVYFNDFLCVYCVYMYVFIQNNLKNKIGITQANKLYKTVLSLINIYT